MKKILFITTLVGMSSLLHATTINAPSSLVGTDALQGVDAYSWGISIPVANGQTVASAEIDFTGITLTASGNPQNTGTLYTDLLKSSTPGVTTTYDGDAAGDYWSTVHGLTITSLGSKFFASVGTTLDWSYVITGSALTALNSYLTAGNGTFDIGLDPDCHYTVGNICFTYTLTPKNNVPDVTATALLLVMGLAGVEIFRRQVVAAKSKA